MVRLAFVSQALGLIGFFIHIWTVWIAYAHDGIWWALFYLLLYIYAEFYWAWNLWTSGEGVAYPLIAGIWAVAYSVCVVMTVIYRKKLQEIADD